jgi:hypothetical protein
MLTDPCGLLLSATSSAAPDAYVEGCEAKLTMYPGAIEALCDNRRSRLCSRPCSQGTRAVGTWRRGRGTRVSGLSLSERAKSHVAFFGLLVAGDSEGALSALHVHLNDWPRDAVVLATTAFTNGLLGNSGRPGQKRALLELLDRLAPSWGDDWWFTAHHGMALSENGQRDAAHPKIERSLAKTRRTPGRRTRSRASAMRKAIQTRPAIPWHLG